MRFFLLLMILVSSMPSAAQKKDKREGHYSAYLYSVEGPKALENYSLDSTKSVWEDPMIKIDWEYAYSQVGFELKNKSDQTIKVLWDDAAYISIANETSRIFHKGIKLIDRENSQPPTSVYKNASLSDLIAPTSLTRYVPGQYGGWRSDPLIPVSQGAMSSKIEYIDAFIGQTMRVVLPLKIGDETIEYIFSFRTMFVPKKGKNYGTDFTY